jgi:hypothetical protein
VPGKKHRYCADCAKRRTSEAQRRYYERHPEKLRQKSKDRWQVTRQDPERLERAKQQRRAHYARNREAWAEKTLFDRHGMTKDELHKMWVAQEGQCYLCERPLALDEAVIDHDHSCCGAEKDLPGLPSRPDAQCL